MKEYALFDSENFETIRLKHNTKHDIPPEGKNGYRNGVEVTDGTGKTTNWILTTPYPIVTLGYIKTAKLDEEDLQHVDSFLTEAEMIEQGYLPNLGGEE